ncbi:hypothetical protein GCM10020229_75490 [Kitasatospora albolonga]
MPVSRSRPKAGISSSTKGWEIITPIRSSTTASSTGTGPGISSGGRKPSPATSIPTAIHRPPAAELLQPGGDPELEGEVDHGADQEEQADRALPTGGLPGRLRQQQVELALQGVEADQRQ